MKTAKSQDTSLFDHFFSLSSSSQSSPHLPCTSSTTSLTTSGTCATVSKSPAHPISTPTSACPQHGAHSTTSAAANKIRITSQISIHVGLRETSQRTVASSFPISITYGLTHRRKKKPLDPVVGSTHARQTPSTDGSCAVTARLNAKLIPTAPPR